MIRLPLAAAFVAGLSTSSWAVEATDAMQAFLDNNIASWAADPVLVDAIIAQNQTTSGYDAATIEQMDAAWRAEVGAGSAPTIDPVLSHPASDFLRAKLSESGGMITEIFVMDAVGLNVAATGVTSDYWQGDEAKHAETYGAGAGAVHFSDIDFDESSQSYQAQISVAITDPASGAVIGALTVGVDAESLM
jgi:hypothetical protein